MNTLYAKRKTNGDVSVESQAINVYTDIEKAKILGFGGAFTEAAAYNYYLMDKPTKKKLIKKYFDKKDGIGYNFCRVHIGSCDFALDQYSLSYKEDLSDFSIERDKKYIIPFVKDALEYTKGNIFLFASPWSPPAFMKDTNKLIGGGRLKDEFYPTYAEYFVKFVKAYKEEGITINALTVQNEAKAVQTWESCVFTAEEEAIFATKYLRPALDKNGFGDVKIILWDHNKERLYDRAKASFAIEGAKDAVWGMGYHWYSGEHFEAIDLTRAAFPDKIVVETELCHGDTRDNTPEQRAMGYAIEYCEDIKHGAHGICDWNMILDTKEGGPFHCRATGGCYAPIYYNNETGDIDEDPIYSALGMFTKYIEPGDVSLAVTTYTSYVRACAVKKADGRLLVFLVNTITDREFDVNIRVDGGKVASFTVPANSVTVNEIN